MTFRQVVNNVAAALVADGINAVAYVPTPVVPPVTIVQASDPWLTEEVDTSFGEYRVWLDVYVWPEKFGENETDETRLTQDVAETSASLHRAGWKAYKVSGPMVWTYDKAAYVGCRIRIYEYYFANEVE